METKENFGDSTNSSEEDTTSSEMSVKELPPQTTFKTLLPVILMLIFIIVTLTNDELGALSGKLGQIDSVKVKSTTLKF